MVALIQAQVTHMSSITLKRERSVVANCLVDTGSQNFYFSGKVFWDLCCNSETIQSIDKEVVTFLGKRHCKFQQVMAVVEFASG